VPVLSLWQAWVDEQAHAGDSHIGLRWPDVRITPALCGRRSPVPEALPGVELQQALNQVAALARHVRLVRPGDVPAR
jgi:hypothetical protein